MKSSRSHRARKELFQRGIQQGVLTVQEIEQALPPGSLSDAEKWLLYYSLRASGVDIRDGEASKVPDLDRSVQLPRD
ncbi:MAG TPA: RNA polymerase sigma factor region1.1 domain-containing protein [Anaeromyxobacteraceae bacterium]|nr:RNA polymerase sigma factor region1.1 domain-containing protein [Anaeromyxobacteraceae bacterium]